jgi:hypothetical protein
MPALQTLSAHGYVPLAGKMPALQTFSAHVYVPLAGKMPALQNEPENFDEFNADNSVWMRQIG